MYKYSPCLKQASSVVYLALQLSNCFDVRLGSSIFTSYRPSSIIFLSHTFGQEFQFSSESHCYVVVTWLLQVWLWDLGLCSRLFVCEVAMAAFHPTSLRLSSTSIFSGGSTLFSFLVGSLRPAYWEPRIIGDSTDWFVWRDVTRDIHSCKGFPK